MLVSGARDLSEANPTCAISFSWGQDVQWFQNNRKCAQVSPRAPLPNTNALNCPSTSSGHCCIFRNTPFLRTMNDLQSPSVMSEPFHGSACPSRSTDQTAMWSRASVQKLQGDKINKDHCQPNHLVKPVPCPDMGLFAH